MKEARYFYVPNAEEKSELPADEALHALRVLRLKAGDELFLMDGAGSFFRAEITVASAKRCMYAVKAVLPQTKTWRGYIHLAIAPTKMMERMEWLAEKITEIGFDELSFLNCQFSERKQVKITRLEKIVVSAVKQSRKAWRPLVHEMKDFKTFVESRQGTRCFIAHCYDEVPKKDLYDELTKYAGNEDVTVLIGPEGDFSIEEVTFALECGCESVSLGASRLRTETAGLLAVSMAQLAFRKRTNETDLK